MRCFQSPMAVDVTRPFKLPLSNLFSSWFDHTIKATLVARNNGRYRNMTMQGIACSFSWALVSKKCLAPSTWRSITPLKTKRFNRVELRTLPFIYKSYPTFKNQSILFICRLGQSIIAMKWMMDPSTHSHFRHPKEGQFQLALCQTPAFRSAHPPNEMNGWPTLNPTSFGFKHETKGEYKSVPHWGSALYMERDTRVETANEGRFSSQVCSERVDGVNY